MNRQAAAKPAEEENEKSLLHVARQIRQPIVQPATQAAENGHGAPAQPAAQIAYPSSHELHDA